jgi:hypothetical protein
MNELAVQEYGNPNQLISLALEKQADPKIIEKLMDLHERWEAGQARRAYVAAMTAFKQEAPAVLKKHDRVDFTSAKGRTAYNYANLGSIVQEITAILGKHNLSASWATGQEANNVTVTCHITHGAGHRESVTLTGPIDESGNKNKIQAVGSTVTYLQRYTLLAALGLATGEDDDGRQGAPKTSAPVQEPKKKPDPPPAATTQETNSVTTAVSGVESKTGTNPKTKKDYTLYGIVGEGGVIYKTFDQALADLARTAQEDGVPVEITYTVGKYGNDIKSLEIAERCPGEEG